MAPYAPAGAVLLAIGSTATVVRHDAVFAALVIVLGILTYLIGVALTRAGIVDGRARE